MKKNEADEMLELLFLQSQIQFGDAVRKRWMHDGDNCPGCGKEITAMKFKKKKALSLNAFIFREHGVLIAYLLCGKCAQQIHGAADKTGQLPIHDKIEETLKSAYIKHLGH